MCYSDGQKHFQVKFTFLKCQRTFLKLCLCIYLQHSLYFLLCVFVIKCNCVNMYEHYINQYNYGRKQVKERDYGFIFLNKNIVSFFENVFSLGTPENLSSVLLVDGTHRQASGYHELHQPLPIDFLFVVVKKR